MDYSKMSDFEINKRVADIAMNGTWHVKPSHPDNDTGGWLYGSNGIQTYDLPDYCNNPAGAWPIIAENGISLIKCTVGSGYWSAEIITDIYDVTDKRFQCQSSFDYQDANPLRAAMIVFLMMQDSANVQDNPA
ncbi:DUF2591 family protein [Citrobacter freundii]|uniref:phage protein NinX family protein n=1 Tax=Citrobacter portucalensis TaxID=1639133 RepID=UPI00374EE374|nr:DUF2591 family protein [Citrobacter freundii]